MESWNIILAGLVMDQFSKPVRQRYTRIKGEEEPTKLNWVFAGEPNHVQGVAYQSFLGNSDHLVELEVLGREEMNATAMDAITEQ